MTEYCGRTSAYGHKHENWREFKGKIPPAISQVTVFNAQWTDCPVEVENEVKRLWRDNELRNDVCYYHWTAEDQVDGGRSHDAETYPLIAEYLASKGVTDCLIHWWW